jgi:2-polyprenyl-3-methyl-5-hydroxy-6-metoxy-1,4-benzoquinol methylase
VATSLSILVRGENPPQSDWLHGALASLGHRIATVTRKPPDVLLVHDAAAVAPHQVTAMRRAGTLTLLRAWRDPETFEAWQGVAGLYDWVLTTGLAEMVTLYQRSGARALPLLPSAPPVAPLKPGPRDIDIIFAGRLDGRERRHRVEFLRRARTRWRVAAIANGDRVGGLHRRSRIAFHLDRIALNRQGVTRGCAGTRPFFGPAFGCALLTELRPWLTHCYDPASELAGFRDVDHAIEMAAGLLDDLPALEVMARRAEERCRREHAAVERARALVGLARGGVPLALRVLALGPWYQQIQLPGGEKTSLLQHSNVERWKRLQPCFPDVRGRSVLDLGMNAGFFSLQCRTLGAATVVGVDASPLACAQARFVFEAYGVSDIEVVTGDVSDAPNRRFDVCLALAILHHEADASRVLRIATERATTLVLEWEVRRTPWFHPIEEVCSILRAWQWTVEICAAGSRPILIARAPRPVP